MTTALLLVTQLDVLNDILDDAVYEEVFIISREGEKLIKMLIHAVVAVLK